MICPRCDSNKVRKMVDSPVGKVREVYLCEECFYSWRLTETINIHENLSWIKKNTDHAGNPPFRLWTNSPKENRQSSYVPDITVIVRHHFFWSQGILWPFIKKRVKE